MDASGGVVVGPLIVNQGKVVRPSPVTESVRRARSGGRAWE